MIKKILFILTLFFVVGCDHGEEQPNQFLTGYWEFNNKTEYIQFMGDDVFIMNDTIQGQYETDSELDNEIWYYYISKSEETEGDGYMYILERNKKYFKIYNLPLHEGDTIKIYKK